MQTALTILSVLLGTLALQVMAGAVYQAIGTWRDRRWYPLVGDDIGGFAGGPPADLLTRWFEVGAFNPIYRDHTMKDSADQEPWVHGPEHEAIRRRYIEERYKLMPYIYTAVEETSRTGVPLMRSIFLEYPQAGAFYGEDGEFLRVN